MSVPVTRARGDDVGRPRLFCLPFLAEQALLGLRQLKSEDLSSSPSRTVDGAARGANAVFLTDIVAPFRTPESGSGSHERGDDADRELFDCGSGELWGAQAKQVSPWLVTHSSWSPRSVSQHIMLISGGPRPTCVI